MIPRGPLQLLPFCDSVILPVLLKPFGDEESRTAHSFHDRGKLDLYSGIRMSTAFPEFLPLTTAENYDGTMIFIELLIITPGAHSQVGMSSSEPTNSNVKFG